MANSTTGLFETLVAPASLTAATVAKFSNAMMDYVYTDAKSTYGTVGQSMVINIPVVAESDVSNISNGAISLTDTNQTPVTVTIDQNISVSKRIQNFDQIRTPIDLQNLYLAGMLESLARKINRGIANLANPAASTGFLSVNSSQSGGGSGEFLRSDVSTAWATLTSQGCPMDPNDTFFVTHPTPYGKMLSDTTNNWIQQYVIGQPAAEKLQQSARFMPQFNMSLDWDQTFPQTSTPKYIGLAFHRYSIGVVTVIPKTPETGDYVKSMVIYPKPSWPVHVQFWYDPKDQGYILHLHCVYGQQVLRPEWGVQVVAG